MSEIMVGILLAVLSIVAGLLYIFIKASNKNFEGRMHDQVSHLVKEFGELKVTFESCNRDVKRKVEDIDVSLNQLKLKVAGEVVAIEDFKEFATQIKSDFSSLREDISKVDKITREQQTLLARIETSLSMLCRG